MTLRRRYVGTALTGALLFTAACGTTVPLAQQGGSSTPQDGLANSSTTGTGADVGTSTDPGTSGSTGGTSGGGSSDTSGGSSTTTGGTGTAGPQPTTPTSAATTAPVTPSGPKITTPIEIGYLGSASPAGVNAALGGGGGTSETPQEGFNYLVQQLNKRGGLAGRQIKPITSFIDPTSSNYDTQAAAACALFTQDHHVAAVLAQEDFYYSEGFSACLKKANVPEIQAITGGVDAKTIASYPLFYSVSAPTVERRFTAMIKGLSDKGYLTKASRIGIIVEDCPYNVRAYDKAIGPAFKARGFNVTKRTISCVHGFGDAAGAIAAFQNQVLPFATAKVDRVMFQTGFEGIGLQYFEQQAKQQGYAPGYALTSTSNSGENAGQLSDAGLQRVQGVGWEPLLDSNALLPNSSATQRCRSLFKGFPPATSRTNNRYNEMLCELFFFYESGLLKTNGHSDVKSIAAALNSLGTGHVSALALTGATQYGPGRKDGPQLFGTFGYLAKCRCIGYTGAPKALA